MSSSWRWRRGGAGRRYIDETDAGVLGGSRLGPTSSSWRSRWRAPSTTGARTAGGGHREVRAHHRGRLRLPLLRLVPRQVEVHEFGRRPVPGGTAKRRDLCGLAAGAKAPKTRRPGTGGCRRTGVPAPVAWWRQGGGRATGQRGCHRARESLVFPSRGAVAGVVVARRAWGAREGRGWS